jgi:hypothetical protein
MSGNAFCSCSLDVFRSIPVRETVGESSESDELPAVRFPPPPPLCRALLSGSAAPNQDVAVTCPREFRTTENVTDGLFGTARSSLRPRTGTPEIRGVQEAGISPREGSAYGLDSRSWPMTTAFARH